MNVPNGARQIALGETGVSRSVGGSAHWWNPAFAATDRSEIEFQVFRWIADARGSFGSARFKTSWGGIGVYYFNQGMDGFEARDQPGTAKGSFTIHQTLFAGGTGFNLWHSIKAGVIFKTAFEDLYSSMEDDFQAFDIGIAWGIKAWSLGASVSNIELINGTDDPFATTLRFGTTHYRKLAQLDLTLSAEGVQLLESDLYVHLGAELGWNELVFLRSGYMTGHDSKNLSFGVGFGLKRYRADLSIIPFDNELGTVWRIGLGLVL